MSLPPPWQGRDKSGTLSGGQVSYAPMIFMRSIAVIVFRNNYDIYFWLLVIILEVADQVYWRVRGSYKRQESLS